MQSQSAAPPACAHPGARRDAFPLAVVTTLFFMWGAITALNDILIPHLKAVYTLSYVQAMLVQFCFFGAYGLVSLPAGLLVRRIGYQRGVVLGLAVAALGCGLFYPASFLGYGWFLLALFVLAAGITTLQVAANPFVTVLGDPATASSRLTLTQAFNALGTTLAPWVGGVLLLSSASSEAELVRMPYLALAAALLLLAALFALVRLPAPGHAAEEGGPVPGPALRTQPHLVLGVLAIFLYVGAEVSIGSFLVDFLAEPHVAAMLAAEAARYVSLYWGGAMVGRFIGFLAMRRINPGRALAFNAVLAGGLAAVAAVAGGPVAMWAVLAVGLFNSIMFPTIFSMALHGLGGQSARASGLLCMAIVGGALVPFAQGVVADAAGLQPSFLAPALCYVFIAWYGWRFAGLARAPKA
jgi:FHS family L-fucose permease-like MFS transporter